ncbi:MAG: SIR2 family NAD-dependent protein deacylase [bacterium]
MAEPPYGIIWNRLKCGKVVPFLGAGASFVGRQDSAKWLKPEDEFLPSGQELANFLALEAEFPSDIPNDREDLSKVSSYYVDIAGRCCLRERLHEVFNRNYRHGALHQFLAEVPCPMVIVVTNYDTLLEEAFRAANRPFDLVIYPSDRKDIAGSVIWQQYGKDEPQEFAPNDLDIDLEHTTVIFKMHGSTLRDSVDFDNYVITEEDYVEFLSRMTMRQAIPHLFYPHFRQRSFLFLGYSLRDWNLRVVLKNLSKYFSCQNGEDPFPSWAIQHNPSELDRKLWEKRNVTIFDVTIEEFVHKIRDRMRC